MQNKTVIIDYGMGNLRSVHKKLKGIGANVIISSDLNDIENAGKLILPGVGHFANGVKKLKEKNLWDLLNKKVLTDKVPVLGICLGMQLMAKHSEEGDENGFGWFNANVVKFKVSDNLKFKVPHMGWNQAPSQRVNSLFDNISDSESYYFVHAYHIICNEQADILATTNYDYDFTSIIHKNNIYGVQFHPEKSHDTGEKMLQNFLKLK